MILLFFRIFLLKVLKCCDSIPIRKGDFINDNSNRKENIQKNILFYRKMRKFTQKQLADFLEIGVSTVSGWERGAYTPDIDTLFRICNFLEVTLNDMCGVFTDNRHLSEGETNLLNTYRLLNKAGQEKLLERAEELTNLGYIKGDSAKMA